MNAKKEKNFGLTSRMLTITELPDLLPGVRAADNAAGDGKPVVSRIWLMRMYSTIVFITAVLLSALAGETAAQHVTLHAKDTPLSEVLATISKQTGYNFVMKNNLLDARQRVSLSVKDAPLKDVVERILADKPLAYEIQDDIKMVVISRRSAVSSSFVAGARVPENLVVAISEVRGKIVDSLGQPLSGASIRVLDPAGKRTSLQTQTDRNGEFMLRNVPDDATLEISYIGYIAQQVRVAANLGTIALRELPSALQEVEVNAGYYTVKDRERTGNISRVTAEEISKQPVSNPLAALMGREAGLEVIQSTGVPGGNFRVRIRGQNSIGSGNEPLYIVDGVPFTSKTLSFNEISGGILAQDFYTNEGGASPLNYLNPADIQSIEVLKDADATAIYGARGANGIILITTKKGIAGKTRVNANFYTGTAKVPHKLSMLSTEQYLEMRHEAFANDEASPTTADAPDLLLWEQDRYTDWQQVLIGGTAKTTDAQLSFSGGEQFTQFSLGGGYHKETTVFPGDNAEQKFTSHFSLVNSSPDQKLKSTLSVNYSAISTNLLTQDLTKNALSYAPNAPAIHDDNGNLNWVPSAWNDSNPNPLSYLNRTYNANTNNLIGNAVISYALFSGLEVKVNLGYTNTRMKALNASPISAFDPERASVLENSTYFSNSSFQNWVVEPQANYKKQIGKGRLDMLIGSTFLEQIEQGEALQGSGFTSEALMKVISAAPQIQRGSGHYSQYRYHALFGRVNYTLNEKYIINVTGRRDGSSRFGPGKQFANFGALGAAWLFFSEPFIQNTLPFLSMGKLRGSYGITGNDQIGDYQYLDAYTSSNSYQNIPGLTPVRMKNPNFAWETNRKMEVALEIGFFSDRILLNASYYRNRSSNQLIGYPLPPNTGFTSIQSNFPATVQNKGWELELNTVNLYDAAIEWSSSFNVTIPRNKLIAFPNLEASSQYGNTLVVGEPLSITKNYRYLGVNPQTGLYSFEDVNGDGTFDITDRNTIKFVGQDYYAGLYNNFRYKGFQVDLLFQFVKQTGYNPLSSSWFTPGTLGNQPAAVMERWQNRGDNVVIQRFGTLFSTTGNPNSLLVISDRAVVDASFIRLKNFSISYSLPGSWLKKLQAENLRLFIQGQNLLTITGYNGLDPETQSTVLPPLRVLTAGIHFTL